MVLRRKWAVVIIFVILIGCWPWGKSAVAEDKKDIWVDGNFDFRQLKIVLVQYSINDDVKLDDIGMQKLDSKLNDIFFNSRSKQKVKFISLAQAEITIGKAAGQDMAELKGKDPGQYNDIMAKNLAGNVDAVLQLKVTAQGYTTKHVEATTQFVTQHFYSYVTQLSGYMNGSPIYTTHTIDNPIIIPVTIPAHDVQVGHAGIEFALQSATSPDPVWRLTDVREADGKDPEDMTERICNRAIAKLTDLVKGKNKKPDQPVNTGSVPWFDKVN